MYTKSVFDVVQKGGSSSKEDRRTSIELSIVKEALTKAQARARWIPHFKNCVDALTKVDLSKCTGALLYLLKTGTFRLVDEASELERRATDANRRTGQEMPQKGPLKLKTILACWFNVVNRILSQCPIGSSSFSFLGHHQCGPLNSIFNLSFWISTLR